MAIGLGWMFGMQLPINFNAPYRATSIISFWRRWHITLSRFLREYLYFPLGGNRRSYGRTLVNIFIVMFLGGIWHGAGWTFIAWGAMHATAIVLNHLWRRYCVGVSLPVLVSWGGTILFVVCAWVLFRAPDMATAMRMYEGMLGVNGVQHAPELLTSVNALTGVPFINGIIQFMKPEDTWLFRFIAGFGVIMLFPTTQYILRYFPSQGDSNAGHCKTLRLGQLEWRPTALWGGVLGVVFGIAFLKLSSLSEFIYFQF